LTIQDSEVVALFTDLITEADEKIRHAMNEIEEPEPVTADMLHSVVKMLEQQLWMIRVQSIRA
jgi:DNA-binding ferritin-like protein